MPRSRGVELLVLPELWSCGYDPETLAEDARRDAEPREGPRSDRLAEAARRHELLLAAGSVPELGEDGGVRHRAGVQPAGRARGVAPQGPSLPADARARPCSPRATGSRRSTTRRSARSASWSVSTGTSPRWRAPSPCAAPGWSWRRLPTRSRAPPAWDLLYPALALTNSQWWVQANQAGSHHTSTLLGASRIIAPTGTVVAEASRAVPGSAEPGRAPGAPHRPALAHQRDGICRPVRGRAPPASTSTGSRPAPEQGRRTVARMTAGPVGSGQPLVGSPPWQPDRATATAGLPLRGPDLHPGHPALHRRAGPRRGPARHPLRRHPGPERLEPPALPLRRPHRRAGGAGRPSG